MQWFMSGRCEGCVGVGRTGASANWSMGGPKMLPRWAPIILHPGTARCQPSHAQAESSTNAGHVRKPSAVHAHIYSRIHVLFTVDLGNMAGVGSHWRRRSASKGRLLFGDTSQQSSQQVVH